MNNILGNVYKRLIELQIRLELHKNILFDSIEF